MTGRRDSYPWTDLVCRAVAAILLASPAAAEPRATELVLHEPLPVEEAPTGPGVRAGAFVLFPVLGLSETYDDNIFAARDNRKDDFIRTIAPSLTAVSKTADHSARLQAGGHAGFYKWHSSENFVDAHLSAEGATTLSPATRIFGGGWVGRDHEERESNYERFGREPTRYWEFRSYGGVQHRLGPLSLRLGGRVERLDFRDTSAAGGAINNDDRDRNIFSGGVQAAYAVTESFEPFVQAAFDLRRYDDARDDNGLTRDSNGTRLLAGARVHPAPTLLASAFAGLMAQDYDDTRLKDVKRPGLGATLHWTPTPETRLSAIVDRVIDETILNHASGVVETSAGLVLRRDVGERLIAHIRLGAGRSEFPGIGREDERVSAGGTLTWQFNSRFSLIGEYNWTGQTSSADGGAYRRNRVVLGVEGRF